MKKFKFKSVFITYVKSMPYLISEGAKWDDQDHYPHVFPDSIKLETDCFKFNCTFDDPPFHVDHFHPFYKEFEQIIIPIFNIARIEINDTEEEICETDEEFKEAIERKNKAKDSKKK